MKPWYIYVAAVGDKKYIKIGISSHPGNRITSLRAQSLNYFGIHEAEYIGVLKDGSPEDEYAIHQRFSHLHVGHEYHRYTQEILDWLKTQEHRMVDRSCWYSRSKVFRPEPLVWIPTSRSTLAKRRAKERQLIAEQRHRSEIARDAAMKRWGCECGTCKTCLRRANKGERSD